MHISRKNEKYFYFSFTLKDTEIFPKLLFWSVSLSNSCCVPQSISSYLSIFDDSSDPLKTENGHHSINLTDDVVHLQSLFKHKTGSLLEWWIWNAVSSKNKYYCKRTQMSWDATTNMTPIDGWICLLLMFLLRAFYCIQMKPSCKLYIMEELSSRNWCIKQECGSIQRRSWSQSTSLVNELSHKLGYQQM